MSCKPVTIAVYGNFLATINSFIDGKVSNLLVLNQYGAWWGFWPGDILKAIVAAVEKAHKV